jgi:hypothetical protein
MNTNQIKRLRYLNIEASEKGLSEFSGNRRVVFIPKDQIQNIEIGFGSSAERPLVQLIFGFLLVGLGLVGLSMIIASGMRGLRWGIGFVVFGGFGIWFLHETLKKSHFLQVVCPNEKRKLVFREKLDKMEFDKFVKDASGLGYNFQNFESAAD